MRMRTRILFIEADQQYRMGLPDGFKRQGCKVMILSDIVEKELKRAIEHFRPHLVMTTGWTKIHTREKLQLLNNTLKKYNVKHAYWATEDPRWREEWSLHYVWTAEPDYIFTIDRDSIPFYKEEIGIPAYYLPWACNPQFHMPTRKKASYACDIAVVASAGVKWKDYRKNSVKMLLQPLIEKGYNVKIWGKRWDQLNADIVGFRVPEKMLMGKLPYSETNHVYSSAKIILGFQNTTTELTSRTYEVLAAQGLLLTPCTKAVQEKFEPGKHLIVSRSYEETLKQVDYYLKNEKERRIIAAAGQKEVYQNHTYSHRAAQILKAVQS